MLSARKYATLSSSYVIQKVLMKSLKESTNDPKEKVIKEFILKQLTYHLESKTNISAAQKSITLVLYLFKFFSE